MLVLVVHTLGEVTARVPFSMMVRAPARPRPPRARAPGAREAAPPSGLLRARRAGLRGAPEEEGCSGHPEQLAGRAGRVPEPLPPEHPRPPPGASGAGAVVNGLGSGSRGASRWRRGSPGRWTRTLLNSLLTRHRPRTLAALELASVNLGAQPPRVRDLLEPFRVRVRAAD